MSSRKANKSSKKVEEQETEIQILNRYSLTGELNLGPIEREAREEKRRKTRIDEAASERVKRQGLNKV